MSQKLEGKIALVTGGSRGIGAAIAKRLAADGANVAITYTKGADAAASVVKEIERSGRKAIAIQADATDAKALESAVEKPVTDLGLLDNLVKSAGTAIPKTFEETTLEEMDRVIDINVRGTFVATQAALKHMKSGGRIIMIGSSVGEHVVVPGLVPYSATKGAVKMFTQGLSREGGSRGINVHNIQPGPIDTDLNPASGDWAVPQKAATALDRYGRAEEIAAMVAFVASPDASYITGTNLTVDGGMNAGAWVHLRPPDMQKGGRPRRCVSQARLAIVGDSSGGIERLLLAKSSPLTLSAASSGFLGRHCHDARRRKTISAYLIFQRTGSILKASTATPRSMPSPLPLNAIDVVPFV